MTSIIQHATYFRLQETSFGRHLDSFYNPGLILKTLMPHKQNMEVKKTSKRFQSDIPRKENVQITSTTPAGAGAGLPHSTRLRVAGDPSRGGARGAGLGQVQVDGRQGRVLEARADDGQLCGGAGGLLVEQGVHHGRRVQGVGRQRQLVLGQGQCTHQPLSLNNNNKYISKNKNFILNETFSRNSQ